MLVAGKEELTHKQERSSLACETLLVLVQEPEQLRVIGPAAATAGFFFEPYHPATARMPAALV